MKRSGYLWLCYFLLLGAMFLSACSLFAPTKKTTGTGVAAPVPTAPKTVAQEEARTQVSLQRAGFWFLVAGTVALGVGFFLSGVLATYGLGSACNGLRGGGATFVFAGSCFLFIAAFVKAFYWTVGLVILTALVGGVLWLWLHRSDILPYLGKGSAVAKVPATPAKSYS